MRERVYRICDAPVWAQTQTQGELPPSELDRRDGYMHLSTARQVPATLGRYFAGREDLVLLTVDRDGLVDGALRYEAPSYVAAKLTGPESDPRGADATRHAHEFGLLFPHFYGRVTCDAIVCADRLDVDASGRHVLPGAVVEAIAAERDDLTSIDLRALWDTRNRVVFIDYPRPSRIDDEAGIYSWEAMLERRIEPLVERHGAKLPAVVGIDNLHVATKLERRYAELADKVISRWFGVVARWTTRARNREFFARVNDARSLPSRVFADRAQALAFVLEAASELRRPA